MTKETDKRGRKPKPIAVEPSSGALKASAAQVLFEPPKLDLPDRPDDAAKGGKDKG